MPVTDQAFVTLATNDMYSQGALVLGKCLRRHETSRLTVVMVTLHVSQGARAALAGVFHQVKEVEVLDSSDWAHLSMMGRPELGVTLTKLHCWALTEYTKCVFLDADMLVLCNVDELFDREDFSAAPDPGWPDCFNSGVFIFRPSLQTHGRLLQRAKENGSFDGGDQGLLNSFFSDWATEDISKHLPFIYNLSTSTIYTYLPAFQQYGREAKIIHFLGAVKPWHCTYDHQKGEVSLGDGSLCHPMLSPFLKQWWAEYWRPGAPSFTQADVWQSPEAHHQKAGSIGTTHQEDLSLHVEQPSTPTASKETGTHSADTPPANEGATSDWTHPLDPPPVEEGGSFGSGALESSQSEEPVLELSASIAEVAIHRTAEEEDQEHKRQWEEGCADYLGKDAFDNIRKKLDKFLK
ncbi:hypothetical protein COCON_G00193680 [Conger conger]|uniref:glycogenin glucosyltransferase n=1 Tax=Conger conger TaxID=82655 RepID=A0A9Q1D112_CONCO|nr:glycogenin-2 [Conger conger]KAJ8255504.1 hypothetical protein COCON_G00193680 [Conger conger]